MDSDCHSKMRKLFCQYFDNLQKFIEQYEHISVSTPTTWNAIINYSNQLKSCNLASLNSTKLITLSRHRENLIFKISDAMQEEIKALNSKVKLLLIISSKLKNKANDVWREHKKMALDLEALSAGSSYVPSINNMLMWLDDSNHFVQTLCGSMQYLIDETVFDDVTSVEYSSEKWKKMNIFQLQEIIPYVQFLKESID